MDNLTRQLGYCYRIYTGGLVCLEQSDIFFLCLWEYNAGVAPNEH